jgi:hypothetical protein
MMICFSHVPTREYLSFSCLSLDIRYWPVIKAFFCSFSSSITFNTAIPTAQDTGFPWLSVILIPIVPPKVLKYSILENASEISGVVTTHPKGHPLPIAED